MTAVVSSDFTSCGPFVDDVSESTFMSLATLGATSSSASLRSRSASSFLISASSIAHRRFASPYVFVRTISIGGWHTTICVARVFTFTSVVSSHESSNGLLSTARLSMTEWYRIIWNLSVQATCKYPTIFPSQWYHLATSFVESPASP